MSAPGSPEVTRRAPHWWSSIVLTAIGLAVVAATALVAPARIPTSSLDGFLPAETNVRGIGPVGSTQPSGEVRQGLLSPGSALSVLTGAAGGPSADPASAAPNSRWLQATRVTSTPDDYGDPVWETIAITTGRFSGTDDALLLVGVTSNSAATTFDPALPVLTAASLQGATVRYTGTRRDGGAQARPTSRPMTAELRTTESPDLPGCRSSTLDVQYEDQATGYRQTLALCPSGVAQPPGLAALVAELPGEPPRGWQALPGATPQAPVPTDGSTPSYRPTGSSTTQRQTWFRPVSSGLWKLSLTPSRTVALTTGAAHSSADLVWASGKVADDPDGAGLQVRWQAAPPGQISALGGAGEVTAVATDARRLTGYGPTGRTLWSVPTDTVLTGLSSDGHGHLIGTSVDGELLSVAAADGRVRWRRRLPVDLPYPALTHDDNVTVLDRGGAVRTVAADTGADRWTVGDDQFTLAATGPEGSLLASSTALRSVAADASTRWSIPLGEEPRDLAVSDSRIVLALSGQTIGLSSRGTRLWQAPACRWLVANGSGVLCRREGRVEDLEAGTGNVRQAWSVPDRALDPEAVPTTEGVLLAEPDVAAPATWRLR